MAMHRVERNYDTFTVRQQEVGVWTEREMRPDEIKQRLIEVIEENKQLKNNRRQAYTLIGTATVLTIISVVLIIISIIGGRP